MKLAQRGATKGERNAAQAAFERLLDRANAEGERMRKPDSGFTQIEVDHFLDSVDSLRSPSEAPGKSRQQRSRLKEPATPKFKVGQFVIVTGSWRPPEVGQIKEIIEEAAKFSYSIRVAHVGNVCRAEAFLRLANHDEVAATQAQSTAKPEEPQPTWQADEVTIIKMAYYTNPNDSKNEIFGSLSYGTRTYIFWGIMRKSLSIRYAKPELADELFRSRLYQGYKELDGTQISGMSWLIPDLLLKVSDKAAQPHQEANVRDGRGQHRF